MTVSNLDAIENKEIDEILSNMIIKSINFLNTLSLLAMSMAIITIIICPIISFIPLFIMWHYDKMIMLEKIEGEILSPEFAKIVRTKIIMKYKKKMKFKV